ncbi:Dehydrogenase (flavoprotein) [Prosthecobacter debontii]|uniref:Dehydrogenase (Flavoprotein) n=1 Tax=Prosthecobacter debontii TaxID=48467 RepID=A0A1T4Y990_9BACT|nr:NAD(P)/FAD-dependent oxidoreductase [Prosthecobacter debontii]SKA98349.1 Dehydrogenase (flavoprotein) [Prosthecobacter debontii]
MTNRLPQIVIVGAGPAGCTLAAFLAQRGLSCVVFDDDKRPDLLVGESLIPGVVPVFRQLGIEDRVAEISVRKPGASFFVTGDGPRIHFSFKNVEGHLPPYSFNSPRPELDNLLRLRAEELGAKFIHARAEVIASEQMGHPTVRLSETSLKQAGLPLDAQPLLIDASGRARCFARAMQIPAIRGGRDDIAYFAHYEDFDHDEVEPGQVIISVLKAGWSWRIPLPGRLSVGIVVDKDHAKTLGTTAEERLETALREEPMLAAKGRRAKRLTPVMTYTNYQLLSTQGYGPGWVLLGDAFGFVDPMLSPGLFMSLEGARQLDACVFAKGADILNHPQALQKALAAYSRRIVQWHHAWTELVNYFYDGRIFRIHLAGKNLAMKPSPFNLASIMERHSTFHIASMASGGYTRSLYSRSLMRLLSKYLVWQVPAAENFAVKKAWPHERGQAA